MRSAFRLLCNALTAFAVVMLGVVVVSAPAVAADSTLPAGFSLCHATGSASTVEGVRNWVRNNPNDSGQASGHAGAGHQNGLDIIPPIPGVLPHGQNWSTYGQQVHANGCNIPTYVDVNATFTDQHCQAKGYVPAAFSAPAYNGITRTVSGLGANGAADPGETVSVSYTGTAATIINGASSNAKSFTHTFPAQPSGLRDCVAQPPAETRSVPRSEPSCALDGVSSWVDVYTTPYVWSDAQQQWVLGQESGPVRTNESVTPYGDDEYFELCAPDRPAAEVRSVPQSTPSCDLAGVTSWNDVYATEYVWSAGQRAWVLGQETGPVKADETFAAFTDEEFFEACAEPQPPSETRSVPESSTSCDPAGVTSWNDVYVTEYVWSAGQRAWVLGQETGPVKTDETFTAYTDEEFFEACAPAQPPAETRGVPQGEPSCALGGVTRWNDVYTTEYVWNADERAWVLGQETGPVRSGVTFSPYTDGEYFELCAPAQPAAEERRVPQNQPSCELGGTRAGSTSTRPSTCGTPMSVPGRRPTRPARSAPTSPSTRTPTTSTTSSARTTSQRRRPAASRRPGRRATRRA